MQPPLIIPHKLKFGKAVEKMEVRPEIKNRIRETCDESLMTWEAKNRNFANKCLQSGNVYIYELVKSEADFIRQELDSRKEKIEAAASCS